MWCMKTVSRIASIPLLLLMSTYSLAVTITFDDIENGFIGPNTYTEAGVTFTSGGGGLGYSGDPGQIHLDDFGTSFTQSVIITAGGRFTMESVDLAGEGPMLIYELVDPVDVTFVSGLYPADGVLVQGIRNGSVVAENWLSLHEISAYTFGAQYSNLDALEITAAVDYTGAEIDLLQAYPGHELIQLDCGEAAPCSHFDIDNVTLTLDAPTPPPCGRYRGPWKRR